MSRAIYLFIGAAWWRSPGICIRELEHYLSMQSTVAFSTHERQVIDDHKSSVTYNDTPYIDTITMELAG